jgi:septal ring factor EnvC (AmiA/AmiB activator)
MTQMQLHYKQLGEHMAIYEPECVAMKHNQAKTMKLEQKISADAKKREDLKLQLDAKDSKIQSVRIDIEKLQRENKSLAHEVRRWMRFGSDFQARATKEQNARVEAEKRLAEVLDAQKKITAMYSGFGK